MTVLFLCVCAVALGQKAPSLVGTWVPDNVKNTAPAQLEKFTMTLLKTGSFSFKGVNTVGSGTYQVVKDKLILVVLKRNGVKPTHPSESRGEGTVVENGKAILMSTGMERNGQPVLMRLVR